MKLNVSNCSGRRSFGLSSHLYTDLRVEKLVHYLHYTHTHLHLCWAIFVNYSLVTTKSYKGPKALQQYFSSFINISNREIQFFFYTSHAIPVKGQGSPSVSQGVQHPSPITVTKMVCKHLVTTLLKCRFMQPLPLAPCVHVLVQAPGLGKGHELIPTTCLFTKLPHRVYNRYVIAPIGVFLLPMSDKEHQ